MWSQLHKAPCGHLGHYPAPLAGFWNVILQVAVLSYVQSQRLTGYRQLTYSILYSYSVLGILTVTDC
jgi:hypothetical protein